MKVNDPFHSKVPGHEGPCKPTWLNLNQIDRRTNGHFVATGFFRNVRRHWLFGWLKYGKEFHGGIKPDRTVHSTELQQTLAQHE